MKIYYSGIGAKKDGIHTEQEFLDIMNKEFTHKDWNKGISWSEQLEFKDWVLPDDFIFLGFIGPTLWSFKIPSVCPSVCPSVTKSSHISHHRNILFFLHEVRGL